MSEETKQAVTTETNVDATPSTEESGAQEQSVDELLSEFDSTDNQTEPTGDKKPVSDQEGSEVKLSPGQRKEIMKDLRADMQVETELSTAVTEIKGDLDVEEEYVRWKLEDMAANDPRVWKAFLARNTNPKAWGAIKKNLQKELSGKYGKTSSTDKEQIASAVHSATQTSGGSAGLDINNMSDVDFEANKEKLFKKARAG